ncbi:Hippurate hydrolase [Lentibacillus sp. JNUCC-1]|uniref:M20 metallopeptidase family protein n=1 Tax=Lentibacillus sp. JNUCC-1 TaxID=2654513 RepID=UPI0013279DEB|nr:M20 family metallopeptidase [Lentibacillus sp. JNUCC-1]MUV36707.1 Hippurate hydrolase [Lentibacillus sp. JNUCC-1]
MTNMMNIMKDVIAFRRDLHRYPELSGEEYETSRKIQEKLAEYGIPYQTGFAGTGVLGIIEGDQPGPTVGLRADIDALPITEKTDEAFRSTIDGVMHACGHDAHTAMLLGTGRLLMAERHNIAGKVLLIFQPAEEDSPTGGAAQMLEDGVFAEHQPDVLVAQHVWPSLPAGQIGVVPGPIMGNSDRFQITVRGSGGHASMPHDTVDALAAANQIFTALQTIVSRNANPFDPAVITVGKMEGGYRYNVIADEVVMEGTIRTQSDAMKHIIKHRFHEVVQGVASSMQAEANIIYYDGYPATVNTERWARRVKQTAAREFGAQQVPEVSPSLGGEDFGRFLERYPGVYYWLGTSIGEGQKPLHDPGFMLDEAALEKGVTLMRQLALDILKDLKDGHYD